LDALLGGGVYCGELTELCGLPCTAKTQVRTSSRTCTTLSEDVATPERCHFSLLLCALLFSALSLSNVHIMGMVCGTDLYEYRCMGR
jgi:hypothetical protein